MIASLMMYARPELDAPLMRYWALIRAGLTARGIPAPAALSNDLEEFAVWQSPGLVLSQTCGMPYRIWLHGQVSLIGTPDFGVEGCPPGYYRSAFVVRRNDPRQQLIDFDTARFAFNQSISHSGYATAYAATNALGFWFQDRLQTGGHLFSARAVADGRADIAAIDAVTWRLAQRFDRFTDDLRVLCWTTPTPGLPYIAAKHADVQRTAKAVKEAIAQLAAPDKDALGLHDLVTISAQDYLAVPNPPKGA